MRLTADGIAMCHTRGVETQVEGAGIETGRGHRVRLLTARLAAVTAKIDAASKAAAMSRQLQIMPGIRPIGALAIEPFAPPLDHRRLASFALRGFHRQIVRCSPMVIGLAQVGLGTSTLELVTGFDLLLPDQQIWPSAMSW